MELKVAGGTHLGICGCYGERTFIISDDTKIKDIPKVLKELIFSELSQNDKDSVMEFYKNPMNKTYMFLNGNQETIFEYKILSYKINI